MKILPHKQGTDAWMEARRGLPTASRFSKIVTAAKGDLSKSADVLIDELLAERFAPEEAGNAYASAGMLRGTAMEPQAFAAYAWKTSAKPVAVGLCLSDCGRYGASPDGLVDDDGGLEIKCPEAKTHLGYLRAGVLPAAYKQQVYGCLAVTGRAWWDFMSFHPSLPAFIVRVERDDYTDRLREAVEAFCVDLEAADAELRAAMDADGIDVGGPEPEPAD